MVYEIFQKVTKFSYVQFNDNILTCIRHYISCLNSGVDATRTYADK
jgi:hypothetical protein